MATGFNANEIKLGNMVNQALAAGVTPEQLGMTGKRTIGPLAQMVVVNGRCVYAVNNDNGIVLGTTFQEAVSTLRQMIASVPRESQPVALGRGDSWEDTRARCS